MVLKTQTCCSLRWGPSIDLQSSEGVNSHIACLITSAAAIGRLQGEKLLSKPTQPKAHLQIQTGRLSPCYCTELKVTGTATHSMWHSALDWSAKVRTHPARSAAHAAAKYSATHAVDNMLSGRRYDGWTTVSIVTTRNCFSSLIPGDGRICGGAATNSHWIRTKLLPAPAACTTGG